MKIVSLHESPRKILPGREMWMLFDPAELDTKSLSVCVIKIPEGESVKPAHSHTDSEEFIYIMAGDGIINLDGRDYELRKGFGILVEKNEVHALRNCSRGFLEAICIFVPPSEPAKYVYS